MTRPTITHGPADTRPVHPMYRPGTWVDAAVATGAFGAFAAGLYAIAAVWS